MAATNQICQMDTITLARAVAAKELSPVEAVEAVLERLDRLDPTLHMFTTVVPTRPGRTPSGWRPTSPPGARSGRWPGCPPGSRT
jgi:aspartyl-tRNA(Asn)/glutamyl-tRNA(Gln) amidotransferase subunit A